MEDEKKPCVCLGNQTYILCALAKNNEITTVTPCLCDSVEIVPARRVVGFFPNPTEKSDKVILLHSPPPGTTKIVLREGGWELPLPTRSTLLKPGFMVLFTLMTKPGNTIIRTDILEADFDTSTKSNAIALFKKLYGSRLELIDLSNIRSNNVKTENYKIYWSEERMRVIFEPVV